VQRVKIKIRILAANSLLLLSIIFSSLSHACARMYRVMYSSSSNIAEWYF